MSNSVLQRRGLTVVAAISLCSCYYTPTTTDIVQADVGERIEESEALALAQRAILSMLKDPDSARLEFGGLQKTWYRMAFGSARFAWAVHGSCNARNSFGGYTGAQPVSVYFNGRSIVAISFDGQMQEFNGGGKTAEQAGLGPK